MRTVTFCKCFRRTSILFCSSTFRPFNRFQFDFASLTAGSELKIVLETSIFSDKRQCGASVTHTYTVVLGQIRERGGYALKKFNLEK